MKSDMIFFSHDGQGLTSTSANHIANLTKEMIGSEEAALEGLVFYSTSVALIGAATSERLNAGYHQECMQAYFLGGNPCVIMNMLSVSAGLSQTCESLIAGGCFCFGAAYGF